MVSFINVSKLFYIASLNVKPHHIEHPEVAVCVNLSPRAIKQEEVPEVKKIKTDPELDALNQKMKEQNQIIFKYRDRLRDNLTKTQLTQLLVYNNQEVPAGEDRVSHVFF